MWGKGMLVATALALPAAAGTASAATLRPGDILVANANTSEAPVVVVDPRTGRQAALTGNDISPTDLLEGTYDLVLDRFGRLFVVDFNPQSGEDGVFRVDIRTGAQEALATGGELVSPFGLDLEADGRLAVGDDTESLVRVDPRSGARTVVSDNDISGPNLFEGLYDVSAAPSGAIFVISWVGAGEIIRVDRSSGRQTLISSNAVSNADLFVDTQGVEVLRGGNLLITDYQAFADSGGGLIGVRVGNGQQFEIASNAQPGPDLFVNPHRTAIDLAGGYVVADFTGPDGAGALIRVDPRTGLQAVVGQRDPRARSLRPLP